LNENSLVEIKCPYRGRNSVIQPNDCFPFLEQINGKVQLKRNHNYFFQITGQLAVSKRQKCFFVVYTFADLFVEEILFDQQFFEDVMFPKLKCFYEQKYRPFIASML